MVVARWEQSDIEGGSQHAADVKKNGQLFALTWHQEQAALTVEVAARRPPRAGSLPERDAQGREVTWSS